MVANGIAREIVMDVKARALRNVCPRELFFLGKSPPVSFPPHTTKLKRMELVQKIHISPFAPSKKRKLGFSHKQTIFKSTIFREYRDQERNKYERNTKKTKTFRENENVRESSLLLMTLSTGI